MEIYYEHCSIAIRSAIIIYFSYENMEKVANQIMEKHQDSVIENCIEQFGLLSESIQVRASISLFNMYQNGIIVDLERTNWLRKKLTNTIKRSTIAISMMDNYCELYEVETGKNIATKRQKFLIRSWHS